MLVFAAVSADGRDRRRTGTGRLMLRSPHLEGRRDRAARRTPTDEAVLGRPVALALDAGPALHRRRPGLRRQGLFGVKAGSSGLSAGRATAPASSTSPPASAVRRRCDRRRRQAQLPDPGLRRRRPAARRLSSCPSRRTGSSP
ncbi:MAG: hypothetical protein MZV64_11900 [Ignavibacteriales bacterium]|nr:hypothetical protein [Ignavibacteriales bacterium]